MDEASSLRRQGASGERMTGHGGGRCPSCERFIGPASVCPYCDADAPPDPALRVLRYASVLLGVAGLLFLYLMATRADHPVIQVGKITPMMNFAYVRVVGEVEREPYVSTREGWREYLHFWVRDGSGRLKVVAYGRLAQRLLADGLLPGRGDRVDVAGSLDVPARGTSRLRLQAAEQLRIEARASSDAGPPGSHGEEIADTGASSAPSR
jgi:hypothetical protein